MKFSGFLQENGALLYEKIAHSPTAQEVKFGAI